MQIGTQIGMQIGTLAQLCVEQVYETGARAGGGGKEAGMAVSSRCLRLPPSLPSLSLPVCPRNSTGQCCKKGLLPSLPVLSLPLL